MSFYTAEGWAILKKHREVMDTITEEEIKLAKEWLIQNKFYTLTEDHDVKCMLADRKILNPTVPNLLDPEFEAKCQRYKDGKIHG